MDILRIDGAEQFKLSINRPNLFYEVGEMFLHFAPSPSLPSTFLYTRAHVHKQVTVISHVLVACFSPKLSVEGEGNTSSDYLQGPPHTEITHSCHCRCGSVRRETWQPRRQRSWSGCSSTLVVAAAGEDARLCSCNAGGWILGSVSRHAVFLDERADMQDLTY